MELSYMTQQNAELQTLFTCKITLLSRINLKTDFNIMKEWTACAKFHSSSKTSGHRWLEQKNMKQNWDNFNYQRVTIVERNTQAAGLSPQ